MKYYVLVNDWKMECVETEIIPKVYKGISLSLGMKLEKLPPIKLVSKKEKLPNSIPNHRNYLYWDQKIQSIIKEFAIDFIQYFDVEIFDENDHMLNNEYKVANVLNVVDAIDKDKSELFTDESGEDIIDITSLHLKPDEIQNEVMFRLEGFTSLLVVREDLAQAIVNAHCTGLEFYDAEGFRI